MKKCPNCNTSNQDFDSICNNCGTSLDNIENSTLMNTTQKDDYTRVNTPKNNLFALISMILGILSLPLSCCCCIGQITAIITIILGFIGKKQIRDSNGAEKGEGLALTGIIIGFVLIFFAIILFIISLVSDSAKLFWEEFWKAFNEEMKNNV